FPHPHGEHVGAAARQKVRREGAAPHVAVHGTGDGGGVGEGVGRLVDVVGQGAADRFAGVERFERGEPARLGADLGGHGVEQLGPELAGHAPPLPLVVAATGGPERGLHFGGGSLGEGGGGFTGRGVQDRTHVTFACFSTLNELRIRVTI